MVDLLEGYNLIIFLAVAVPATFVIGKLLELGE